MTLAAFDDSDDANIDGGGDADYQGYQDNGIAYTATGVPVNDDPGFFSGLLDPIVDFFIPNLGTATAQDADDYQGTPDAAGQVLQTVGNGVQSVESTVSGLTDSGFPLWGYLLLFLLIAIVVAYVAREVVG